MTCQNQAAWAFISVTLAMAASRCPAASFQGLGDLAGGQYQSQAAGISGDGRVVVGWSESASGPQAFAWQSGAMTGLGDLPGGSFNSRATAVSADGSVIVGRGYTASGISAFRYAADASGQKVMTPLEDLPGGGSQSEACAVSPDGTVIVGSSRSANGYEACWWGAGVQGLGDLAGGAFGSVALGVSEDGVVVGSGLVPFEANSLDVNMAFRWTADTSMAPMFPDWLPLQVDAHSIATAISADGTTIVGRSMAGAGWGASHAWRWTVEGFTSLTDMGEWEDFPDVSTGSATAVNADGSVVVGHSNNEAFVWTAVYGTRLLKDILMESGALPAGWTLTEATGVSADGQYVVGYGRNPSGQSEAWIAHIPEPATLILLTLAGLLALRHSRPPA